MHKKLKFEKILIPLIIFILAFAFFIFYRLERQRFESGIEAKLNKIKTDIEKFISSEFIKTVKMQSQTGVFLKEPVISFNAFDMSVTPPVFKERVLSFLEYKTIDFSHDTLLRIKKMLNSTDGSVAAETMSYYLNDRNDGFVAEKAVLYLRLIELKLSGGYDCEKETASFNHLLSFISSEKEKKFLSDKFVEIIKNFQISASPEKSGILSAMINYAEKNENGNQSVSALASFIRLDVAANLAPSIKSVSINDSEELIISGKIEKDVFAASFIDIEKLNVELKARFNAFVSSGKSGQPYNISLPGPFKIYVSSIDVYSLNFQRLFLYFPLVMIIAVLMYLKMREGEAVRLNLQMTEFVSKISHQLKTPLSSSLLHLELAERHFNDGDHEKARESLAASGEQARNLSFLFENFSVLNRLFSDNVSLVLEKIDLEEEILKYIKLYKYQVESGLVKFIMTGDPLSAMADRWAFYNIMNNLVANSLKYCLIKPVEISFSMSVSGNFSVLSVSDNGPGVPEDDLYKIFEKFYKGENARQEFRSTGLGLYIARSLAQKSGGDIAVDKNFKSGAKFDIYLKKAD